LPAKKQKTILAVFYFPYDLYILKPGTNKNKTANLTIKNM